MNSLYHIALYDGRRFITLVHPRHVDRALGIVRLELDLSPIGVIRCAPSLLEQCPFGPANHKRPVADMPELLP